jgi:hypothetical protein
LLTLVSILKYVIVGDAAVGKSSLLLRLTDDRYGGTEPTLGVEFGSRILSVGDEGKRVKVQCELGELGVESSRDVKWRFTVTHAPRLGHGWNRELPEHHAELLPRGGGRAARVRRHAARE